jgi:hypothetical protein
MSDDATRPLVVVDAANVVGSVPDGWWRDRAGATERLRDSLADIARAGLPATDEAAPIPEFADRPVDVVLVVEGQAKGVPGTETVRVLAATGSGDDAIVDLVRAEGGGRSCVVVTADRELRSRVRALGADVAGPRVVRR